MPVSSSESDSVSGAGTQVLLTGKVLKTNLSNFCKYYNGYEAHKPVIHAAVESGLTRTQTLGVVLSMRRFFLAMSRAFSETCT